MIGPMESYQGVDFTLSDPNGKVLVWFEIVGQSIDKNIERAASAVVENHEEDRWSSYCLT